MGPIDDVGNKLRSKRQLDLAAIHESHLFLVNHKQMVTTGFSANIDVLSQLDVAVGPEDEEPAIAPDTQPVGRKPIHAHIAGSAVSVDHHVSEILEFWVGGVVHIGDLRSRYLSAGRSGVVDKLVCLVRTDIAENSAVLSRIPKPVRASNVIH